MKRPYLRHPPRTRTERRKWLSCGLIAVLALSCGTSTSAPEANSSSGRGGSGQASGGTSTVQGGTSGASAVQGGTSGASAVQGGTSGASTSLAGASASGGGAAHGGTGTAGATSESGGSAGAGGTSAGNGGAGASAACPFATAEYPIWPSAAPGTTPTQLVEVTTDRSTDATLKDRSITGVSKPTVFPFLAKHPNGAAAIVLPGGGYTHLALDKEGVDIAAWLNTLGVSAFVLKYRLPSDFPGSPWIPLADAQRALRTVRQNAMACGIDPARLGVFGFSAGGHLASQLETRSNAVTIPAAYAKDTVDAVDARPSFGVLMYPVISMDAAIAHAGSKTALLGSNPSPAEVTLYSSELQVTSTTPATFIGVSSKDSTVDPQNSIRFDNALKAAAVIEELHLYQDGAHGVGIRDATGDMAAWPTQCATWLTGLKLIAAAQ